MIAALQKVANAIILPGFSGLSISLTHYDIVFNPSTLRIALVTLSKNLDETYERILCRITEAFGDYALRILQWLAYSMNSLTLRELEEVIAIPLEDDSRYDPTARFPDRKDLLKICSGLVEIDSNPNNKNLEFYISD